MRELKFTHWNQDYINALSDDGYNLLKRSEVDLANQLQDFLAAYDIRPDEYNDEYYINSQELLHVFYSFVDLEEFCLKFDEDKILNGVKLKGGWMRQIHTTGLRWIKLHDVPRIIDCYLDSICQDKTADQLQAVNQLVEKHRGYMTMLKSMEHKPD